MNKNLGAPAFFEKNKINIDLFTFKKMSNKLKINANHQIILPLRRCNNCKSHNVTSTQSPNWEDCTVIHCVICENQWYVCTTHAKRFSSSSYRNMNRHFSVHHSNDNIIGSQSDNMECIQLSNSISEDDLFNSDNPSNKRPMLTNQEPENNMTAIFKRSKIVHSSTNNGFFNDEMEQNDNGIHGLVSKSFQRCEQQNNKIDHEEALFHMQLTNVLTSLPENNQATLVMLLNKARNINFNNTRLPRSINDTRTFYTGNKTSIYNNIPTPIVSIHDNHAYVSIASVIHHALSLGIVIPLLKSSQFPK